MYPAINNFSSCVVSLYMALNIAGFLGVFFSSVICGLRSVEMRGMSRTFAYLVPSNVIEVGFAAHKVSSNVTLPIGGGRIAY